MNIYVGNLSAKTTEEELREAFESFGDVDSAKIIKDNLTGRSRGFGFVEMPNQDQAQAAIAGMNGKELAGSALTVNEAKPRESRGGGGRSFGGGGRPGGSRPPVEAAAMAAAAGTDAAVAVAVGRAVAAAVAAAADAHTK